MTIGIYALFWPQSNMVYIGKGTPIENRWHNHKNKMKKNDHPNWKIQEQYNLYGYPETLIIEECSPFDAPKLEVYWEKEFNSVSAGLNIAHPTGEEFHYGISGPHSKYSKRQILKVFALMYKNKMLDADISKKLNVNRSLLTNIRYNQQHNWLKEEYPKQYAMMSNKPLGCNKGINNPMSKYSRKSILKVFSLLYSTTLSRTAIAVRTKVKESTIKDITSNKGHIWLEKEYPNQYAKMLEVRKSICKKYGR